MVMVVSMPVMCNERVKTAVEFLGKVTGESTLIYDADPF